MSARNLVANHMKSQKRIKRGGQINKISLEEFGNEVAQLDELSADNSPEKVYEKRWATTILDMAMEHLKSEYIRKGKEKQYDLLEPLVFKLDAGDSHKEVAKELAQSVNWVSVNVVRMREKAAKMLRQCVEETLTNKEMVDEEFQHLLEILTS